MDEQAATTDPYVDVEEEGEDGAVENQDVKEEEEEEQPWGDSWNEEWGWEHEGWYGSHDTWNWDDSETTVKAEPVGETSSSSKGDKSWGGNWWSKSWSNNDEKSWHANDGKSLYSKDDKSWHAKQQWSQRHPPKQEYLDWCSEGVYIYIYGLLYFGVWRWYSNMFVNSFCLSYDVDLHVFPELL